MNYFASQLEPIEPIEPLAFWFVFGAVVVGFLVMVYKGRKKD